MVSPDPGWEPLLITVPEPDYPSGHGVLSGVAEAVLRRYLFYHTYHICCISSQQYWELVFCHWYMPGLVR